MWHLKRWRVRGHLLAKGCRSASPDVGATPHQCPMGSWLRRGPWPSWKGRHCPGRHPPLEHWNGKIISDEMSGCWDPITWSEIRAQQVVFSWLGIRGAFIKFDRSQSYHTLPRYKYLVKWSTNSLILYYTIICFVFRARRRSEWQWETHTHAHTDTRRPKKKCDR